MFSSWWVSRRLGIFFAFVAFSVSMYGLVDAAQAGKFGVSVQIGLNGVWKVGFETCHRITLNRKSESNTNEPVVNQGYVELTTTDGDGVPVVYHDDRWKFDLTNQVSQTIEVLGSHGRANRSISVSIYSSDGVLIQEHALTNEERGTSLPATQPLVVGIGGNLNLNQAAMQSAKGALPEYSSIHIDRIDDLSHYAESYSGVDLLVISSGNEALNRSLSKSQGIAIRNWVERGGRCLLTLGANAQSLLENQDIAAMIPGRFTSVAPDCDPAILESLVGNQSQSGKFKQLGSLDCALFEWNGGLVDVTTQTSARVRFPLISRWAVGLGKVQFFATELDSNVLNAWPNRSALLKHFYKDQWEKGDSRTGKRLYQGYDDLSGQLNATLDYFPNLKLGNLAVLSLIAGLFSLVIGPFDYYIMSKAWNKPRMTWLTLIATSLGGCLTVIGLNLAWKPSEPSIKSVELIDIDIESKRVFGNLYAHCYGGLRGGFDISVTRGSFAPSDNNRAKASDPTLELNWFGQPGRGLGGFDSMVTTDREMPSYRISTDQNGSRSLESVGIPAAGTKALCGSWSESFVTVPDTGSLSTVPGTIDLLDGTFVNPLDVDLLNGFLFYRGRAYGLSSRLRPGARTNFTSATIPKDITRRLQRRQNIAGEETGSPWDSADVGKVDRLFELICFHRSAGADAYTSLTNRYLSNLDNSDLLKLDRAILFAEIVDPSMKWSLRRNSIEVPNVSGENRSFVRIVVPVTPRVKKSSLAPNN